MLHLREISSFIQYAVECSVYLEPTDPGLSYEEIMESCTRAGYQPGESSDAFQQSGIDVYFGSRKKLQPSRNTISNWQIYMLRENPDYRNFSAFDFVVKELNAVARAVGANAAKIDRQVLIERGLSTHLPKRDLEAAITIMIMCEHLREHDGAISLAAGRTGAPLPSEQQRSFSDMGSSLKPERKKAYDIVADIISRRSDGRARNVEPLDAFSDQLIVLGYSEFRQWWTQTVAELRKADPLVAPLSITILSAALVEGAITFIVRHARSMDRGYFSSPDYDRPPRTWRIEALVASASTARDGAILDDNAKQRAMTLIQTRQRIHAGRMLEDFPRGVPDLRPEEARDARSTAEVVVRRVLDWLQQNPPV